MTTRRLTLKWIVIGSIVSFLLLYLLGFLSALLSVNPDDPPSTSIFFITITNPLYGVMFSTMMTAGLAFLVPAGIIFTVGFSIEKLLRIKKRD